MVSPGHNSYLISALGILGVSGQIWVLTVGAAGGDFQQQSPYLGEYYR